LELIRRHDKGAMGIVTRTGGTIAFFGKLPVNVRSAQADQLAAMGFSFSFTQAAVSNIRQVGLFPYTVWQN